MLGINAEPVHVFHRFWEKAIPQYEVGYGKIRSKLDALETSHPGLHFTGNYRGISVADTILHALKLTDLLRELQTEKFSLHGTKFVAIEINTYFRELKMNQVKQPKQPKALPSLKDAVSFRLLP